MQLVDGKSLRQLLDEQKRLSPELTIHIGTCVAVGARRRPPRRLRAPRRQAGQHPDHPRRPGAAHRLRHRQGPRQSSGDDLTSDNVMMGTAKYLSPEQVRGRKLDGRADLYSLGLVLYECLAGRVPFLGETDADTALARLQRDPTDLARLRPTLPDGPRRPDPPPARRATRTDRPATGAELRAELHRASPTSRRPTSPRSAAPPAPQRRRPPARSARPCAPPRQTGQRPRTRPGAPPIPGEATPAEPGQPTRRAITRPNAGPGLRGKPAKGLQPRTGPSMVLVLRAARRRARRRPRAVGRRSARRRPTATAPTDDRRPPARRPTAAPPAAPATITGVTTPTTPTATARRTTPRPPALADGNPARPGRRVCYAIAYRRWQGRRRAGRLAVGAPRTGTLTFDVVNAPYQVEVFGSDADAVPTDFAGWGPPSADQASADSPRHGRRRDARRRRATC